MVKRILRKFLNRPEKGYTVGSMGENCVIMPACDLGHPENITLGDNVYIGTGCKIYAQGGVTIKNGTILADTVDIRTANHYYDGTELNMLPFDEKVLLSAVTIQENVWIASNVLILPGITVGEGSVVAAGSVVAKDVPPLAVVGGNPAKVIKYRDKERYLELKNQNKQFMQGYHTIERKTILVQKTSSMYK